jgi:DTW domain-containing protein YfiP
MSRKRGTSESFSAYRKNLKTEAAVLKRKLRGVVVWDGSWGQARKIYIKGKPYLTGGHRTIAIRHANNN